MTAARAAGEADIVIVGAGPAGASLARLLALRGRRPILVGAPPPDGDRLEVIAPAVLPVIDALGLMPLLSDPDVARPCLGIRRHAAGRSAPPETDAFLRRPGGRGFVVDRARFDHFLRRAAQEAGADLRRATVAAAGRDEGGILLRLRDAAGQGLLRTRLLIDATGRRASLARRLGGELRRAEKRVAGLVATSRTDDAQAPRWLEVVTARDSWSYSVAGPGGRREGWHVAREAARLRPLARKVVDAGAAVLLRAAGPGWMAVGDAAAAFDPITSQGLANALGTALAAAGALASDPDLGPEVQQAYADAVLTTFAASEAQRRAVYRVM